VAGDAGEVPTASASNLGTPDVAGLIEETLLPESTDMAEALGSAAGPTVAAAGEKALAGISTRRFSEV
jgi:hypothetical protein